MGQCRQEHTENFQHFEPPPGWGMDDLDLGENLDDKTGSVLRWVVSIRIAAGVSDPQLRAQGGAVAAEFRGSPDSVLRARARNERR